MRPGGQLNLDRYMFAPLRSVLTTPFPHFPDPFDGHDEDESETPKGQRQLGAKAEQIEPTRDCLKNSERDNETGHPSKTAIWIDTSENRRENCDQKVGLTEIRTSRIEPSHRDDGRDPAQYAGQHIDRDLNATMVHTGEPGRFQI